MASRWNVLLPKTKFPLRVNPITHEPSVQAAAKFDDLYDWQLGRDSDKQFTLHDGPPYANGEPHMGHVLNKVLKDIINRYKLMTGHKILYRPGWDCHGLPIELKACKKMRGDSSPLDIRAKASEFASKTMELQRNAFKRWGILADWNNPYITMNRDYEAVQLRVFYDMYKKGCIYRGVKPVYWSPSSHTALAEAELEYQQHSSRAVYVLFPCTIPQLADHGLVHALVWTTTPWTLPANRAIAYHSDHEYSLVRQRESSRLLLVGAQRLPALSAFIGDYDHLCTITGKTLAGGVYRNPIDPTHHQLPLLPAHHVTSEEGTGLVHTAPAHGFDDYTLGLEHKLDLSCAVDDRGRYMDTIRPDLSGQNVLGSGNEAVIALLAAEGCLLHEESYAHRYPYDWRSKKPVIIRSTKQWFASVRSLQPGVAQALEGVVTIPENSVSHMSRMISQRDDWCISRQRVWGVPIPAFFSKNNDSELLISDDSIDHIIKLVSAHGTDCWWDMTIEQLLPPSLGDRAQDYQRGQDTMDVWFDSGSSWACVLGDQGGMADMYLEGKDQYRGWFQSSLLTSLATLNRAPYRQLVTHGFVLDRDGAKMSKSLGNVISPDEIINKRRLGADVMRLWVASSHYVSDVAISSGILDQVSEFLQKTRNTVRFLLGNLNGFDLKSGLVPYHQLPPLDRYQLHLLHCHCTIAQRAYETLNFLKVYSSLIEYVPFDLSAFYFDIVKDRLYCESVHSPSRRAVLTVFHQILQYLSMSIAPILPHLVEEVAQHYPFDNGVCVCGGGEGRV